MQKEKEIVTLYDAKYDLVKFTLSLFVIAIHATLWPYALYPWLRIAVPLFFMISAYFVFGKLKNCPVEQHKTILKKYVSRNALLYACWFVILSPMTYLLKHKVFFDNGIKGVFLFVQQLFFGNTFLASWFIPAVVFGVLIVYQLSKWVRKDGVLLIVALLVFAVVTLRSAYSSQIGDTWLGHFLGGYTQILGNPVYNFSASIVWIFVGKCFAEGKVRIPAVWVLIGVLFVSCLVLYAEWRYVLSLGGYYGCDSYFALLPVCVTLFALITCCKPIYWKPSIHFKRASTVIYVAHASILPVFNEVGRRFLGGKIPLLSFVATAITCIIAYIVIAFLVNKCRECKIGKVFTWLY